MDSTSGFVQNQAVTRRRVIGAAVALVAAPFTAGAEQGSMSLAEVSKEDLHGLCLDMLALRSWWDHYGDAISQVDRKVAGSVHDIFVSGAATARVLARRANLDVSNTGAGSYSWGSTAHIIRFAQVPA